MSPRWIVPLLVIATLAGCAESPADEPALDAEEARALLLDAGDAFPEAFSFEVDAYDAQDEAVLALRGGVEGEERGYFELSGDPAAFGQEGPAASLFGDGFALHLTPQAAVYLFGEAAVVAPPGGGAAGGFALPHESGGGLEGLTQPSRLFSQLGSDNLSVTGVRETTARGQAAYAIDFRTDPPQGEGTSGTAVVFEEPRRVASVAATREGATQGPVRYEAEFFYDEEAQFAPTPKAQRAVALAFTSDANPFAGGNRGNQTLTWTFLGQGEAAVADATLVAHAPPAEGLAPAPEDVLWTFPLSEEETTQGNLTLRFVDADEDARLTQGDRLEILAGEDAEVPALVLRDEQSGVHVLDLNALIGHLFRAAFG